MFGVVCRPDHIIGGKAERARAHQAGEEKVQGELTCCVNKYLAEGCKSARPFSVVPTERTGSSGID